MAENQTRPTGASVMKFIGGVEHDTRRADAKKLVALMRRVTRTPPKMWGPAIIGFGTSHYKYASGREGDMPRLGFSPRKQQLALYLSREVYPMAAKGLGKHEVCGSCLYIKKLSDVDEKVLETMVRASWKIAREKYGR